ncbi:hypothetical protein BGW42_003673 [Actinomortierella wolfii]|nr:hypothetical protein BGW42_003673 [Actinomortierella wolfii]KAG0229646.1 hypothetical protein BGW41_002915 [Actinomortierella wolfii]
MEPTFTFTEFPGDGMISLPRTVSTKCHYGLAEKSLVASATYFQFAVGNIQKFDNIIATILDDHTSLPLLRYMKVAINEGKFENPTNSSTLVVLGKILSGVSDADFFLCISEYRKEQGTMGLICTYMLASIIVVSPQAVDPVIAAELPRGPETQNKFNVTNQIDFTIHHLPRTAKQDGDQGTDPLFSSAQLVNATTGATRYLASLGHNVYIYEDQESKADQLYILYDIIELKDAYEVSTICLVLVCVLTVLFGLIWIFSKRLPIIYSSTLYMTIYKELNTTDETVPMLMRYTRDPLEFDGNQVILRSEDFPNITSETQDHPMITLQRPNSILER